MRLWFCLGTAGELIKIYPLLKLAEERGILWFCLSTGQSAINLKKQWSDFGLPATQLGVLTLTDRDLDRSSEALRWFFRANLKNQLRQKVREVSGHDPSPKDFWIVHGDTLSTLVGSLYGKRLGVPVAHLEAGLRSSKIFEPFPEEITRRMVSRFAKIHFPQDQKAEENLKKSRVAGKVVPTHANTLLDAIRQVLKEKSKIEIPSKPYVVANLHRFENLGSSSRWQQMVDVLLRTAKMGYEVHFVLHPPTQAKIESDPELQRTFAQAGIKLIPRMPFTEFIHLLNRADFVLSDGGSNQEECFYLGKPCLLLRDSTERVEGLKDGPCLLSQFKPELIDRFLAEPILYKRDTFDSQISPSQVVLDYLSNV